MKRLSKMNAALINNAVGMIGTYDPDEIVFIFEERLTRSELQAIEPFLAWVHASDKRPTCDALIPLYQEYVKSGSK